MAKKTVHVHILNLENAENRKKYEEIQAWLVNQPQKYMLLRPIEKIVKTVTSGDIDSRSSYQEIWMLVEYMEIEGAPNKKENTEIFEKR